MSVDMEQHRPLARLLIRLMGLFFIIGGLDGIISNGIDVYLRVRAFHEQGMQYQPATALAWTVGSAFSLLAGLYLAFKGGAALDLVFHESLARPAVPCPDCGFDLRGTPSDAQRCPECGTDLHRKA